MCIFDDRERDDQLTLVHLHVCDGLPFVHGHKPLLVTGASAAEVNDQLALVTTQSLQHIIQPWLAELAPWEEKGCDDDLANWFSLL